VTVEHTQDDITIVKGGVRPGEQIVASGHDRVQPGAYVSVVRPSRPVARETPNPSPAPVIAAATPTPPPNAAPSPMAAVALAAPTPAPSPAASPPADAQPAASAGAQGTFVIGDENAVIGKKVYFWGGKWAKNNRLSKGAAPRGFAGYALIDGAVPECGKTWRLQSDARLTPPADLPPELTAVVTSSAKKSGKITTGDIRTVVVIKPDKGYSPRRTGRGTGTIVSVTCQ
jgi:hypothetical protein